MTLLQRTLAHTCAEPTVPAGATAVDACRAEIKPHQNVSKKPNRSNQQGKQSDGDEKLPAASSGGWENLQLSP